MVKLARDDWEDLSARSGGSGPWALAPVLPLLFSSLRPSYGNVPLSELLLWRPRALEPPRPRSQWWGGFVSGQRLLEVQVRLRRYCHYCHLGQWVELQQLQPRFLRLLSSPSLHLLKLLLFLSPQPLHDLLWMTEANKR
ncbi:hypothetical protein EYF80_041829 [Liparis tanakae]|uniref:Uncharacterized protein n=1 Tax=Liparis tanakae TaxID=230148 RepID=A0A4Z2G336_9TELE|nr:hypothetical protein EYF80_041829 [Liparis tanakae]